MKNLVLYLCSITIFSLVVQSRKPFSRYAIIYRDANCTYNPKYVRYLSCDIMQPKNQSISSYLIYAIDMHPGLMVNVRIDVPRPNGVIMNVVDLNLNVCEFFDKESENHLIKMGRKSFDEYGNYTSCPHQKDFAYGLFNWTFDVTNLPYAPESDFVINMVYSLPQNIETIRVRINGRLDLRRKRPMRVLT